MGRVDGDARFGCCVRTLSAYVPSQELLLFPIFFGWFVMWSSAATVQELDRSIVSVGAGAFSCSTHDTPTSPSRPRVVELVSVTEGAPRMYVQHKPPFVAAAVDGEKAEVLTVYR